MSLNYQLSVILQQIFKEMRKIWYLLKCSKENEADYKDKFYEFVAAERLLEVVSFQCQRMMRYNSEWHLERRTLLPGYIFLSGSRAMVLKKEISLRPCSPPYLKELCQDGNLIGMSRGIIKDGIPIVTSGPLRGREQLIRRIDRHKRTAEIMVPIDGWEEKATIGLEIYQKQ